MAGKNQVGATRICKSIVESKNKFFDSKLDLINSCHVIPN